MGRGAPSFVAPLPPGRLGCGLRTARSPARPRLAAASPRRPRSSATRMSFLGAVHTAPEFIAHVLASCGAGLFGLVGFRATRGPRALMAARFAADRRAEAEARHVRALRRAELAEGARLGVARDWADMDVDAADNLLVPLSASMLGGASQFRAFDSALGDVGDMDRKIAAGAEEREREGGSDVEAGDVGDEDEPAA